MEKMPWARVLLEAPEVRVIGESPTATGADGSRKPAPAAMRERLHFLDWARLLMVMGVVYAHTALSGLSGGGGFNESWLIDDQNLYYNSDFRAHVLPKNHSGYAGGPAPYATRWISIIRQWCLPLLFWVSGAAVACSYRGGMPRGLCKLTSFSALGMLFNACLWFLSPRINDCIVDAPECEGKGILFDFSICGRAGWWFAIIFQMWYTVVLMAFCLISWPLFAVIHGSARVPWLALQWLLSMMLYTALILASGSACPDPVLALLVTACLEASFLVLVSLDPPLATRCVRPKWFPVRALHYALATVALLQFGAVSYAKGMSSIGPAYLAFIITGFKRFFHLGFIMTHARLGLMGDRAEPLLSSVWPVMLFLVAVVAPSTNWDLAGMLTYPFYIHAIDRCLYIAGALVLTFILDRVSRGVYCQPLPDLLSQTSVLLYLFHPVLITVLLAAGMRSVMGVWLMSVGIALSMVALISAAHGLFSRWGNKEIPSSIDDLSDRSSQCSSLSDNHGDGIGEEEEESE